MIRARPPRPSELPALVLRSAVAFGAVALFSLGACGAPRGERFSVEPPRSARPAESPRRDASGDELLSARVAEMVRASDVRNLALGLEQSPPPGYVPFDSVRKDIPAGFQRVVAYVLNYDRGLRHHLGSGMRCRTAVAPDGTLCPSVVLPGVALSAPQVDRVRRLAAQQPAVPRVSTCAARARHSFVFYDEARVPVFEWAVNLECGRGSMSPWVLDRTTRDSLAALCRELGLGLCFLGDANAREAADRAFAERYAERLPLRGWRTRPFSPGIARERRLNSLAPHERRLLCAWNIQHTTMALDPGGEGRNAENGARWSLTGFDECWRRFPDCPHTLGEVLPCVTEAQRGAPVFMSFSDPECLKLRACLWGFELSVPSCFESRATSGAARLLFAKPHSVKQCAQARDGTAHGSSGRGVQ